MPPDQLGRDPVRDVIDGVPGFVAALGGDPRVEHGLHQDVAQFLAQRPLVSGLQGLDGLVGLLEQVRRQRGVGLPGVPRTLHPQPVHGGDQVDEVRAGQVRRAVHQPGAGRDRRVGSRHGQPHHQGIRVGRLVGHLAGDPGVVERGQLGMVGRREHQRGRPQRLPGRPAEQAGCHPRAGGQDDQQAGACPDGDAVGAGPAARDTVLGAGTTVNCV